MVNSVTEQNSKENIQQNWIFGNILSQMKNDNLNSADGSPVRSHDETASSNPSIEVGLAELQKVVNSPQQKPVNLLPEVPMQTSRKLSEREQRDCDVIGIQFE